MNFEQKKQLKGLWIKLSAYYGVQLQDQVLDMYAEDVSDLPFAEILRAMEAYRKNPKNVRLPLPAMIRNLVQPEVDDDSLARDAASRAVAAVAKFGWNNPSEAKGYIGELGWRVVERFGGWVYVCQNLGVNLDVTTFQAQVRDIAKAQIVMGRAGRLDSPPALPQPTERSVLGQVTKLLNSVKSIDGGDAE